MAHIRIRRGVDLPIGGTADPGEKIPVSLRRFSYDLRPFSDLLLRLAVQEGQKIEPGQLLAFEEGGLRFVCPVGAIVTSILRGERRRLLEIQLDPTGVEPLVVPKTSLLQENPASILFRLNEVGLLALFCSRPFGLPVDPRKSPRSIFVRAVESAPLTPSAESQVEGNEEAFCTGLRLLARLGCKVHVVTATTSSLQALGSGCGVQLHTVEGPHPAANPSVHIAHIDPIRTPDDIVWTLPAKAVVTIGNYCLSGRLWNQHLVAICGTGLLPHQRKTIHTFPGFLLAPFFQDNPVARIISGDPLTGVQVPADSFARWSDSVICAIPDEKAAPRTSLHFLRLRATSFSAAHTYLPAHHAAFSTSLHGEERAYIDGSIYEKVMPFGILPIQLVKAVLAHDFERAIEYGFLEIVPEDFALADFICPSKNSMMEIVRTGQQQFWHEHVAGRKSA